MDPDNNQPPEFVDPNTVVPDGTPTYVAPADDSRAAEVGEKTGAETNYINPNQVNTMGTNAVRMGGKAWVWWTVAGVITTLVILLAGTYYFYKVRNIDKSPNTIVSSKATVSKDDWGQLSEPGFEDGLFRQFLIQQYGEEKAKKIAKSSNYVIDNNSETVLANMRLVEGLKDVATDFHSWRLTPMFDADKGIYGELHFDIYLYRHTATQASQKFNSTTPKGGMVWEFSDSNFNTLPYQDSDKCVPEYLKTINAMFGAAGYKERATALNDKYTTGNHGFIYSDDTWVDFWPSSDCKLASFRFSHK